MTQLDLNKAVARATGESVAMVNHFGFQLADPFEVRFDPEPRRPLMLDWDNMSAAEWPRI